MNQRDDILKRVQGATLEDVIRIEDLSGNIKLVLTFSNFDNQICIMEVSPAQVVSIGSKLLISPEINMVISDWVERVEGMK